MTTKNIEWLIGRLRAFSGTSLAPALMHQAADTLQSQAERVKALELDLDVQAGSIEAVQAVNMRQAERIKALEAAPQVGYFYKWKEAMHGIARLMDERDTLRAKLAAVAAAEPVLVVEKEPDYWSGGHFHEGSKPYIKRHTLWRLPIGTQLFTRPMPAQDVTELVEALENLARLGNGEHYGNSDGNMIARTALSKYKGAK